MEAMNAEPDPAAIDEALVMARLEPCWDITVEAGAMPDGMVLVGASPVGDGGSMFLMIDALVGVATADFAESDEAIEGVIEGLYERLVLVRAGFGDADEAG